MANANNEILTILNYHDIEAQPQPLTQPLTQRPREQLDLQMSVFKTVMTIIILILGTPIVVSDLYFGFTDTSCSEKEPNELVLTLSLKTYLLTSGFIEIVAMAIMLIAVNCILGDIIGETNQSPCILFCVIVSYTSIYLFVIVWDIFGAIVFWGYINGNDNCDKTFSTYVFVTLIIKIVSTVVGLLLHRNEH